MSFAGRSYTWPKWLPKMKALLTLLLQCVHIKWNVFTLYQEEYFLYTMSLWVCYCCRASAGSRPYSWSISDFWFDGSMVRWFHGSMVICDCSALQSAFCLSKCLAAAPVFLLGATRHFVLLSSKICAEIVVYRMFAVFLNCLNGKNSSRSIYCKEHFFHFF